MTKNGLLHRQSSPIKQNLLPLLRFTQEGVGYSVRGRNIQDLPGKEVEMLLNRCLGWSSSASDLPVVCGFFKLCMKDFTTQIQTTIRVCLLKQRPVKQGRA